MSVNENGILREGHGSRPMISCLNDLYRCSQWWSHEYAAVKERDDDGIDRMMFEIPDNEKYYFFMWRVLLGVPVSLDPLLPTWLMKNA